MRWQPTKGRPLASFLLTPARIVVGVGSALSIVAGLRPWAEGLAPGHTGIEPVFFSGLGGAGDGLVLIVVSLAVGLLTLHRTPATSRVRSVRLAPAILVVLAALTWVNGYRAALAAIEDWERRGGHGDIGVGLWQAALGIVLMAAGTLWLLPEVIRWERRTDDPSDLVTVRRHDVAVALAGAVGTLVGGVAGVTLALAITGPTIVGMIALGAVFGGMLGLYGGAAIGRMVGTRLSGT